MATISDHRKPEGTAGLDLVRVRLWYGQDDSDVEYYELPGRTVDQLAEFVETGRVASKIRAGLQAALQGFPSWTDLSLDANLSKEQREAIVGEFVRADGRAMEFRLDLNVPLY